MEKRTSQIVAGSKVTATSWNFAKKQAVQTIHPFFPPFHAGFSHGWRANKRAKFAGSARWRRGLYIVPVQGGCYSIPSCQERRVINLDPRSGRNRARVDNRIRRVRWNPCSKGGLPIIRVVACDSRQKIVFLLRY